MRKRHVLALGGVVTTTLALAPGPATGADTPPEFVVGILGDSYAAGEGAPDVFGHHDAGGDFACPLGDCFAETWWVESSPVTFPQVAVL